MKFLVTLLLALSSFPCHAFAGDEALTRIELATDKTKSHITFQSLYNGDIMQKAEVATANSMLAIRFGKLPPQKYSVLLPQITGYGLSAASSTERLKVRTAVLSEGAAQDRVAGIVEAPLLRGLATISFGSVIGRNTKTAGQGDDTGGAMVLKCRFGSSDYGAETEAAISAYSPSAGTSSNDNAVRASVFAGDGTARSRISYQRIGPRYSFLTNTVSPQDREEVMLTASWSPGESHRLEAAVVDWETNIENSQSRPTRKGVSLDLAYRLAIVQWLPVQFSYRQEKESMTNAGSGREIRSRSGRSTLTKLGSQVDFEVDAGATVREDIETGEEINRKIFLSVSPKVRLKAFRLEPTLKAERVHDSGTGVASDLYAMRFLISKPFLKGATFEAEGGYHFLNRKAYADDETFGAGLSFRMPLKSFFRKTPGRLTMKTDYRKQRLIPADPSTFSFFLGLESG